MGVDVAVEGLHVWVCGGGDEGLMLRWCVEVGAEVGRVWLWGWGGDAAESAAQPENVSHYVRNTTPNYRDQNLLKKKPNDLSIRRS